MGEIVAAVIVFLLLVALLGPERKTRQERLMLNAFPKGQWRVLPSMENKGKWGLFEGGLMWGDWDTQEEAEVMKKRMTSHASQGDRSIPPHPVSLFLKKFKTAIWGA